MFITIFNSSRHLILSVKASFNTPADNYSQCFVSFTKSSHDEAFDCPFLSRIVFYFLCVCLERFLNSWTVSGSISWCFSPLLQSLYNGTTTIYLKCKRKKFTKRDREIVWYVQVFKVLKWAKSHFKNCDFVLYIFFPRQNLSLRRERIPFINGTTISFSD